MKTSTDKTEKDVSSWPLLLIALPAGVATWSGWVGLGRMTGFGKVQPLPGIADSFTVDTAITLPIGVEAYAAYALGAWLSSVPHSKSTKRFAAVSAVGSLVLGMAGQVAYHLLETTGKDHAPWWITTLVSCLPVLVLGMGAALRHMLHRDKADRAAADIPADTTPAVAVNEGDMTPGVATSEGDMTPDIVDADRDTTADIDADMSRDADRDATPDEGDIDRAAEGDMTPDNVTALPVADEVSRDMTPVKHTRPRLVADADHTERALELLAAEPDIKGAELGRRLGLSERQGQRLLASLRPALQEATS